MATEKIKVFEEGSAKKGLPIWAWLLPLLLLLLLGAWLLSRHHEPGTTASTVSDSTKPDTSAGITPGSAWTAASISDSLTKNGRVAFSDAEVHFATASAALAGDSQAVLDQAALSLKDHADWRVRVVGYTDSVGSSDSNAQLAQQRAESVKGYLVAHGVAASGLDTEAKGANAPVATNSTDTGRAENRRVELIKE